MALHALHGTTDAVVLIDFADGELVVVDWGRKDYWWVGHTGSFPSDPTVTRVRLFRGDGARLPFLKERPADLSSLLWAVGRYAFPTSTAWWLRDDARYRLVRWPDLASVDHEPEHVSMTAKLSAGAFNAGELAAATGSDVLAAQQLLNALGLMNLLREDTTPPVHLAAQPARAAGLFARLRARLGV